MFVLGELYMADKKLNIAATVQNAVEHVAPPLGLDLWDVLFIKEGPSWFLRLIIDKPGGVSLDDCEAFSRAVDPIIEELNPTEIEYFLEVSSPGLGRALRTDEHLKAYEGKPVVAKLYQPLDGEREFSGNLKSYDKETITIETSAGGVKTLSRQDIATLKADDDHI